MSIRKDISTIVIYLEAKFSMIYTHIIILLRIQLEILQQIPPIKYNCSEVCMVNRIYDRKDYIDSRENKLVSYTEYRLHTTKSSLVSYTEYGLHTTKSSPAKHFG